MAELDSEDAPLAEECEADNCKAQPKSRLYHCAGCSSTYCSACWPTQTAHKPGKKLRGPSMHNKVDIGVIRRYQSSLNPTRDVSIIEKLHEEDQKTRWFGVTRETSQTLFEDHDRFAAITADMVQTKGLENRYPKLVSFIGVTNAGKSTLIKMLIERETVGGSGPNANDFPAPVVGSAAHDSQTTSDGVHLYADPATHMELSPILFADCEGLEGGEKSPMGAPRQERGQHHRPAGTWRNARPIKWANTEDTSKREFAVTTLYPRLLYTFSDCVVFVLRNPKTFASAVLTKLIAWGAAALETSVNQPTLPHCIVVLNGSDAGIDHREWSSNYATHSLLSTVGDACDRVEGMPQFREAVEYWQRLGKSIDTIKDLILCYYATFTVVRVPAGPQYTLIDEQIDKLHAAIRISCEASHRAKRRARLLTSADELGTYLQSGFDHFITHLDVPFNFMQVSLARNPIPQNFGGHILQFCEALSYRMPSWEPAEVEWMLQELSSVLASCVLLDCARFRKGQLDQLFENYVHFFDYAITEYLQLFCPCSFVSSDGMRICRSVKARHQIKGHQDEHGIIAAGDYTSPFDDDFATKWMSKLKLAIEKLHLSFSRDIEKVAQIRSNKALSEESIAFAFHSRNLRQFFRSLGPTTIRSNSTCLCCMMHGPQHPLPCGHVLCDWCVRACGTLNDTTLRVSWCPLHRDSTRWSEPKIIKYKPSEAGVRILALDGGGVRGAVQLEILRGIERAIGNRIPVMAFFDLIVGTGTGGLIATTMAKQNTTLDHCNAAFTIICKSAYAAKNPGQVLKSRLVRTFGSGPQYKESFLCDALRHEFTEKSDFFGTSEQFRSETKVAVITTDPMTHRTTVVGNYRKASDVSAEYDFERPHNPAMELKTWQAVYASMADPRYFVPLRFGKTYCGGGSTCVNPALIAFLESQRIWPDVAEPDILLSLGTGQDRTTILDELKSETLEIDSLDSELRLRNWLRKAHKSTKWLLRHDKDVLDAERSWRDFIAMNARKESHRAMRKCIRLNIDFGQEEPPSQDRESHIRRISMLVRDKLQEPSLLGALRTVAYRLVATSLFFRVDKRGRNAVSGHVCCRFEEGSEDVKGLGMMLCDRRDDRFQPCFTVTSDTEPHKARLRMDITSSTLSSMTEQGSFNHPKVSIPLVNDGEIISINLVLREHDNLQTEGYPISGFPRVILGSGSVSRPTSGATDSTVFSKSDATRAGSSGVTLPYVSKKLSSLARGHISATDLTGKALSNHLMADQLDTISPIHESPPPYKY